MTAAPRLQLSDAERRIVEGILQRHVPELEVWAFGSRASGTAKRYSDLDVVVVTEDPLPPARYAELAEAFSESDLPWKVDLVDWATTSEHFRQILRATRVSLTSPVAAASME